VNWFSQRKSLDLATVSKWIGSVRSKRDKDAFHTMRKHTQQRMFNEIVTHLVPVESDEDAELAYLMVQFYSGRAYLPVFGEVLEMRPKVSSMAASLFASFTATNAPTEQFNMTAICNCSVEVTNEAIEHNYENAAMLADHGIRLWPEVGELWRQRGVMRLAQDDYIGALSDLHHANILKPGMIWIDEPINFASKEAGRHK
jgi:hypothetical protein